jgi:hypothetical protein
VVRGANRPSPNSSREELDRFGRVRNW